MDPMTECKWTTDHQMGRGTWSSCCWFWVVQPRALPRPVWRTIDSKGHYGSSLWLWYGGSDPRTLPRPVIKTTTPGGLRGMTPELGRFYLTPTSLPMDREVVHIPRRNMWSITSRMWSMSSSADRGSYHGLRTMLWSTIFWCFSAATSKYDFWGVISLNTLYFIFWNIFIAWIYWTIIRVLNYYTYIYIECFFSICMYKYIEYFLSMCMLNI